MTQTLHAFGGTSSIQQLQQLHPLQAPQHGGDLARAIQQFGGPADTWIDCSTGIAPQSYPLGDVPMSVWQSLPDRQDELLRTASLYYGCSASHLLALAGSQAAIQALPALRTRSRVGILAPSYAEHAWCWQQHGHVVIGLEADQIEAHLHHLDVLIVVNPNNPTGKQYPAAQLKQWHKQLQRHDGWLIVDEAFADLDPQHSLMPDVGMGGLIVLRSVGKFFGLAGLRLGFAGLEGRLKHQLQRRLGLWSVSGIAEWVGPQIFVDQVWQDQQRERIQMAHQWMSTTLKQVGLSNRSPHPMLHWCPHPRAFALQRALAEQHIWCRLLEYPSALRFGLIQPQQQAKFLSGITQAMQSVA